MKKIAIAMALLLFVSCNPNSIPPPNRDLLIIVENRSGDNLLDPAFEGNILDDDITIEYKGKTISLGNGSEGVSFLTEIHAGAPWLNALRFGWFLCNDHTLKSFIIDWGDGTSDEVAFEWYRDDNHDDTFHVWLNGESQSNAVMTVKIIR